MILLLFRNATTRLSQDLAEISPEFCHQSGVPGYLTPEKAPCYLKNYATESTGKAFDCKFFVIFVCFVVDKYYPKIEEKIG